MRAMLKTVLLAVVLLFATTPGIVSAYSYGDANTEDVAETFKLIVADLNKTPADWAGALAAHNTRRAEIASHFGEEVAATLDADIQQQKLDETIANYKALLVMNLNRRFNNAVESLKDYSQAKLLLAKAKATYETLEPYAEASLSKQETAAIENDFQTALDAIGNPGLFGVGKKEADPAALKAALNRIYTKLEPLFPYKAAEAGAAVGGTGGEGTAGNGKSGEAITGETANAPMERTQDTNAGVSIAVIGGVIIVAGAVLWYGKRKRWF